MIILPQQVGIKCNSRNKKHFETKGYIWEYNKSISVNALDLCNSSKTKVALYCDYCLEKGIEKIIYSSFSLFIKNKNNKLKDCCIECSTMKQKETLLKKYGVSNAMHIDTVVEAHKERMEERKPKIEEITIEFTKKNYVLISEKYENNHTYLEYICLDHEDKGLQTIYYSNFKNGHGCYYCGRERTMACHIGEKSHLWKGGISPLNKYFREKIDVWKYDSLKYYDFKCVITGENNGKLVVHHTYNFSQILTETLKELNLSIHSEINKYSKDELESIEKLLLQKHYDYGLGVPLLDEVHIEFHREYRKVNNTPEQFEEFKTNYTKSKEVVNNEKVESSL